MGKFTSVLIDWFNSFKKFVNLIGKAFNNFIFWPILWMVRFYQNRIVYFCKKCINSRKNRLFSSSWKVPFCGGFASLYLVAIGVIDIKRCLPVSIFQSNSHFFGMYNVRMCMQGLDFIVFSRNTFFFQENIQLCRVVICRAFFWHVGVNACKALSANRMFGGFFFQKHNWVFFLANNKRQIEFIWIRLWCEWFRLIEMAFRFLHDNDSNQNSIYLQALFRVLITSTQRHKKQPFLNYNNDEDLSPTSVIRSTCKSFSKLFLLCAFHTLINKIT